MAESSPVPPVSSTFVVRFWKECSAAGPRWRGRIEHVQSDQSAAILGLDGMRSFGEAGCYFYRNAFTRITGVPGASGEEEARHQCLRLAKVGDDSRGCYAFRGFGQIKLTTNEGDAINLSTSKVVF